ncbi:predicted protein [Chaetoceros tenuissimus]|uniref:Uncharacterized protein n=1 Tax=Chaetoceros tenuissimus TaxID=426638 RepID=A0AAD3CEE1_9STRA|nr:predicted protein [Chaetoceros tenuissimus]
MISTSSANKLSSKSLARLPILDRHQEERIRDDPTDMEQRTANSTRVILSHVLPKFPNLEDSSTEATAAGSNGNSTSRKNRVGLIPDPLVTRLQGRKRKYRRTSSSLSLLQATDSKSLLDRSQSKVCKRNATWAFRREEPPSFYQSEDKLFDAIVFGNSENAPNRSSYISYQSRSQQQE